MIEGKQLYREHLENIADKLEATGIQSAARIVRQAATPAESKVSTKIAKIMADPVRGNRRAYLGQMLRRGEVTLDEMAAGSVDPETPGFVARSVRIRQALFEPKPHERLM